MSSQVTGAGKRSWHAGLGTRAEGQQPATSLARAFLGGTGHVVALERYGTVVARILISQIFILSGITKIMDPAGTAAQMEARGMLWTAAAVELGAGLCLLFGFKTRLAALALFLFLIPVTLTFHNFWTYAEPKERTQNMIMLMHNLTLMGGLLLVMTFGPGPFSLDWRKGEPDEGGPDRRLGREDRGR
jgi:putative oxidoreductase